MTAISNIDSVRVRFAPSPTGPLHIGGVRTALYNYLFAKKHNGTFILRIEDTDQTRYVEGAEKYIQDALHWFGLHFDEGPEQGGDYGPYRQSERKDLYKKYAEQLIKNGHAYYAFDSEQDLEEMREREKLKGNHTPKYDASIRDTMKTSLNMTEEQVQAYLEKGENITVRLLIPKDENVVIEDIVRGQVTFSSNELDDKVILKNDGMPTYHLANIVDDHSMEITHVIRGEEWLSSTAHHVLMYRFFEWKAPSFAHLPLILKPTGKGKLSKRDGAKFGFPVFPMEWQDGEELFSGFKEAGFLPEAVLNFLVLLGWNPGDDTEMMTLDEMCKAFSLDRIVKSGARFDFDKAKWFNQQYFIKAKNYELLPMVREVLVSHDIEDLEDDFLLGVIELMKERVEVSDDFYTNATFFYHKPTEYDLKTFKKKYKAENAGHFDAILSGLESCDDWNTDAITQVIKGYIQDNELSFGAILPILRIFITGTVKGPDLFPTLELLGKTEVIERWRMNAESLTAAS